MKKPWQYILMQSWFEDAFWCFTSILTLCRILSVAIFNPFFISSQCNQEINLFCFTQNNHKTNFVIVKFFDFLIYFFQVMQHLFLENSWFSNLMQMLKKLLNDFFQSLPSVVYHQLQKDVCISVHTHTHTHTHIYIYIYIYI